jgi:hypothetical protein
MKSKPFSFLFFLILLGAPVFAQTDFKREFEQSIRKSQTPQEILESLSPFMDQARRVRCFRQVDGQELSWEVKMNYRGRQFSIEFYDDYTLKDIEELIRWRKLEFTTRKSIEEFFKENYSRYRIKRFQKQFIPQEGEYLFSFIANTLTNASIKPDGYEIEAEVRNNETGELGFFEYQFDSEFRLKRKRKIIHDPDGNLLF